MLNFASPYSGSKSGSLPKEGTPDLAKAPLVIAILHRSWISHSNTILVSNSYFRVSQWERSNPFYCSNTSKNLSLLMPDPVRNIPTHPRWPSPFPTSQQVYGLLVPVDWYMEHLHVFLNYNASGPPTCTPFLLSKSNLICTHTPVFHCNLKTQKLPSSFSLWLQIEVQEAT